ncbi:MAG: LytTR family DNA-binding domain-containing protein, partial [Hymenobacteraceae bacterium]|nr:LytTR family DNA-binding domain-containing protein [Hymenobacteraceae bacterium]MDX5397654.1 LytTR family DNA-binding domain-containing protein [Hymenobacteraceae bacterium]MDX5513731.1 LytTR family DNA-binding domain-containing protein [Hymenobacteraceae bacterium]
IDADVEILAVTDSIEASVNWLQDNPAPDLIVSDIQLADGSSFEIFRETEVTTPVIFTTAFDEFAIEAFKVNSIDYLLKPIKREELSNSLIKYRKLRRVQAAPIDYTKLLEVLQPQPKSFQKRIVIRFGNSIKKVEIEDVAYFYTHEKVTFLCTFGCKRLPVDYNLDQLEEILDPSVFFRINRQFVVNIAAIDTMHAYSKSRVKIELNPECDLETIVSTERSSGFKHWLTGKE